METKSISKRMKEFITPEKAETLSSFQRTVSIIGGAYMLLSAASNITSKKKHGVVGPLWNAVSGGYLIYRGVTGHCPIKEALNRSNNKIVSYLHKN